MVLYTCVETDMHLLFESLETPQEIFSLNAFPNLAILWCYPFNADNRLLETLQEKGPYEPGYPLLEFSSIIVCFYHPPTIFTAQF